ncbi:hypothetical protein [Candidatus Uabimicrobium amorphum]|uniref:Uncharacterized protein n=1 Tax=Uabimicrobium amorphum TaxID=2596890 RepID=A0A5S9IU22_UABAM|nr:hypothetical protein [Candidatus Uabimicrobium amorphum]BBM87777.1 hypothetical protein UABAM_06192 [Candidatus Uabimicrobium amorphum]
MKSINAIAILGIFTTFLLVIMMLFTLESSPEIKKIVDMSNQIKFDQNLEFVSIYQAEHRCRVLIQSSINNDTDLKSEVNKIGNYIWRKFSFEAQFEELEIVYHGKVGSGCNRDTITVKEKIDNPMKKMEFPFKRK